MPPPTGWSARSPEVSVPGSTNRSVGGRPAWVTLSLATARWDAVGGPPVGDRCAVGCRARPLTIHTSRAARTRRAPAERGTRRQIRPSARPRHPAASPVPSCSLVSRPFAARPAGSQPSPSCRPRVSTPSCAAPGTAARRSSRGEGRFDACPNPGEDPQTAIGVIHRPANVGDSRRPDDDLHPRSAGLARTWVIPVVSPTVFTHIRGAATRSGGTPTASLRSWCCCRPGSLLRMCVVAPDSCCCSGTQREFGPEPGATTRADGVGRSICPSPWRPQIDQ